MKGSELFQTGESCEPAFSEYGSCGPHWVTCLLFDRHRLRFGLLVLVVGQFWILCFVSL